MYDWFTEALAYVDLIHSGTGGKMTFVIGKENERVSTGDIKTLLERTEARQLPINHRDITTFIRYPGGSLPEHCVGMQMLPTVFEANSNSTPSMFISQLSLTPSDELCMVTKISGKFVAICGNRKYTYKLTPQKRGISEKTQMRVIGFTPKGQPIAYEDIYAKCSSDSNALYIGNRRVDGNFEQPSMLPGNIIIFKGHEDIIHTDAYLMKPPYKEMVATRTGGWIPPYWGLDPSGKLLYVSAYVSTVRDQPPCLVDAKSRLSSLAFRFITYISHSRGEQYFLDYFGSVKQFDAEGNLQEMPGKIECFRDVEYKWGLTRVDDRSEGVNPKWCFVVKRRDGLESWVVNEVAQPPFDLVSPLFQKDGNWFYYAYIAGRRQLLTMTIP